MLYVYQLEKTITTLRNTTEKVFYPVRYYWLHYTYYCHHTYMYTMVGRLFQTCQFKEYAVCISRIYSIVCTQNQCDLRNVCLNLYKIDSGKKKKKPNF